MVRSTSGRRKRPRTKIPANLPALGAARFDLKYGMGGLSQKALTTTIELYGAEVIPRVREALAGLDGDVTQVQ